MQYMLLLKAFKIAKYADIIGALSLDAYDGRIDPFLPQIQEARPHPGQIETARNIRTLLNDSEFQKKKKSGYRIRILSVVYPRSTVPAKIASCMLPQ